MKPELLSQFHRKLMKQLHPDKNSHPKAKEAFHKVQEAIKVVKKINSNQTNGQTESNRQQYYYPADASFN